VEDKGNPSRVAVTDAWRKEQQAKRDAYETKRRAWVRTFERGIEVDEDDVPAAGTAETSGVVRPERRGRRGGTIRDQRQTRFTF
jgi:hypothetical protein